MGSGSSFVGVSHILMVLALIQKFFPSVKKGSGGGC